MITVGMVWRLLRYPDRVMNLDITELVPVSGM